jgi:hypothetical protein
VEIPEISQVKAMQQQQRERQNRGHYAVSKSLLNATIAIPYFGNKEICANILTYCSEGKVIILLLNILLSTPTVLFKAVPNICLRTGC